MNFKSFFKKGKKTAEERGGAESFKADAGELRDIAGGKGNIAEKAQDGTEAIRDPGAPDEAQ
jgi:hypothetical protein